MSALPSASSGSIDSSSVASVVDSDNYAFLNHPNHSKPYANQQETDIATSIRDNLASNSVNGDGSAHSSIALDSSISSSVCHPSSSHFLPHSTSADTLSATTIAISAPHSTSAMSVDPESSVSDPQISPLSASESSVAPADHSLQGENGIDTDSDPSAEALNHDIHLAALEDEAADDSDSDSEVFAALEDERQGQTAEAENGKQANNSQTANQTDQKPANNSSASSSSRPHSSSNDLTEEELLQRRRLHKGTSCHQCKNVKDFHQLVFCANSFRNRTKSGKRICRKKYCDMCLKRYYNEILKDIRHKRDWICVSCRGQCCCASCQRQIRSRILLEKLAKAQAALPVKSAPPKATPAFPGQPPQFASPVSVTQAQAVSSSSVMSVPVPPVPIYNMPQQVQLPVPVTLMPQPHTHPHAQFLAHQHAQPASLVDSWGRNAAAQSDVHAANAQAQAHAQQLYLISLQQAQAHAQQQQFAQSYLSPSVPVPPYMANHLVQSSVYPSASHISSHSHLHAHSMSQYPYSPYPFMHPAAAAAPFNGVSSAHMPVLSGPNHASFGSAYAAQNYLLHNRSPHPSAMAYPGPARPRMSGQPGMDQSSSSLTVAVPPFAGPAPSHSHSQLGSSSGSLVPSPAGKSAPARHFSPDQRDWPYPKPVMNGNLAAASSSVGSMRSMQQMMGPSNPAAAAAQQQSSAAAVNARPAGSPLSGSDASSTLSVANLRNLNQPK